MMSQLVKPEVGMVLTWLDRLQPVSRRTIVGSMAQTAEIPTLLRIIQLPLTGLTNMRHVNDQLEKPVGEM
jgi:hypothetical protein